MINTILHPPFSSMAYHMLVTVGIEGLIMTLDLISGAQVMKLVHLLGKC
mgnify:CR=1 FL=1